MSKENIVYVEKKKKTTHHLICAVIAAFLLAALSSPGTVSGSSLDSVKVGVLSTSGWDGATADGGSSFSFWWSCEVKNYCEDLVKIRIEVYLKDRKGDTLASIYSRSIQVKGKCYRDVTGPAWIPADIRWRVTEVIFRIFGDIRGLLGNPVKNDVLTIKED